MLAVVIASLLPPNHNIPFSGLASDKAKHFVSYAILAHIACHAGREWRNRLLLCTSTFIVSVIIEFLQPYTGRDFEFLDIVANLSGVLAGIGAMILFLHWRQTKLQP